MHTPIGWWFRIDDVVCGIFSVGIEIGVTMFYYFKSGGLLYGA